MNTYTIRVTRVVKDIGYVDIEAKDGKDALRKYWEPDFSKGENLIFDDEIEWQDPAARYEYTAEIVNGRS